MVQNRFMTAETRLLKLPQHFESSHLPNGNHNAPDVTTGTETGIETVDDVQTPKMFKVLILNDDFTPMDFVILVLRRFFGKSEELATQIMLDVHQKGSGVAGVYTLETAEMKVMQTNQFSRMNQHPLKATLEEAQA